jgi:hypothetical protein
MVKITYSVFLEMGIFVDLLLCGVIITEAAEYVIQWLNEDTDREM